MHEQEFIQRYALRTDTAGELGRFSAEDIEEFENASQEFGYKSFAGFLAINGSSCSAKASLRAIGLPASYLERVGAVAGPYVITAADGRRRRYNNGIMLYKKEAVVERRTQ